MSSQKAVRTAKMRSFTAGARRLYCNLLFPAFLLLIIGCTIYQNSAESPSGFWAGVRPASGETERLMRNVRFLKKAGRTHLALKELEEAHQRDPHNLQIVDTLTQCYEELGEWERAEELYLEALAKDDSNPALGNNLCFSYYLAGKFAKAETCFRKLLERHPHNVTIRNNLGLVLTRMGRQDEAYALWREAEGERAARHRLDQALAAAGLTPAPVAKQPERQTVARNSSLPTSLRMAASKQSPVPGTPQAPSGSTLNGLTPPYTESNAARKALLQDKAVADRATQVEIAQNIEPLATAAGAQTGQNSVARSLFPDIKREITENPAATPEATAQQGAAIQTEVAAASFPEDRNRNQKNSQPGPAPLTPAPAVAAMAMAMPTRTQRLPILRAWELLYTKIEILNGNGVNNLARRNRSWLHLEGFDTVAIGNYENFAQEQTVIIYRPQAARVAKVLGTKFFRTDNFRVNPELAENLEVRVVLGRDVLQKEDVLAKLAK
jgi:Tfp pilus assembly protein PilF